MGNTSWKFEVHDSVVDTIPKFDLILTRHTMIHLNQKTGVELLQNFYNSGSHFLLTSNYPDLKRNKELDTKRKGRFRELNLHLPPYNLPPPVCQSEHDAQKKECYIALWELDSIGSFLS